MSSPTIRKLSKPSYSPSTRQSTPRKLHAPLQEEQQPATPSPKQKTASSSRLEQRDDSPAPEERQQQQSQASGSVGPSQAKGSGLGSVFGGVADTLKGTVQGVEKTGESAVSGVADVLPLDLSVLKGLEVGEEGKIFGQDGNALGQVVEGDPTELLGWVVGDAGEILDNDGDLIGRVELLPETAQELGGQVAETVGGLADLHGLAVGEGGLIKNDAGEIIGRVVEGDVQGLIGHTLNDHGEILDEAGELIGRAEVVQRVQDTLGPDDSVSGVGSKGVQKGEVEGVAEDVKSKLSVKEPRPEEDVEQEKISLKDAEATEGAGSTFQDAQSKLSQKDGEATAVPGSVAQDAQSKISQKDGEATEVPGSVAQDVQSKASLKGSKAPASNVDDAQSKLSLKDAEATEVAGSTAEDVKSKLSGEGSQVPKSVAEDAQSKIPDAEAPGSAAEDAQSKLSGTVPEVAGSTAEDVQSKVSGTGSQAKSAADDAASKADGATSKLEDGTEKAEEGTEKPSEAAGSAAGVPEGEAADAPSEAGTDTAQTALESIENTEDEAKELPSLDILEGLKPNKTGNIINPLTGKPVGKVVEGDIKKLVKLGAQLDDKGQFWDNRGNVIGRAETIPVEEYHEDPPFAGLEGLHVVEDGFVEDENGKRVGKIVEGDAKKILGRAVDEDGEVTDSHGNVIAKAEYYEAPEEIPEEEPEPEVVDLSFLNGLTPNKLGLVIGPNGVPIARVVEGNPKELAGKEIDEGVIYDGRKPIGRVEPIPDNEREKKAEGQFAALGNLVVNKEGFVEDESGTIVGKVTEGDPKDLRGRSVDEDGDIIDKFGTVKGHADRYEVPEEEKVEEDLSILEGKTVNKAGNVVDGSGTVFGRAVNFDKGLVGRKVDGLGQIWGDNGKVIGRAELLKGGEQEKPEGPFVGFETAVVGKEGLVVDASGRVIGRLIEGDPKRLEGRKVDEDGDIVDKNGNSLGRAERWEPEEKKRIVNPMSGRKVTREGEVRDADGNLIGKVTSGNLSSLIGKEIDDNGYVVDNDGNKMGECTLIENIPEPEPEPEEPAPEEPGPSPEELEAARKEEEDRKLAKNMSIIIGQTLDKVIPICKRITDYIEKAERTPKDELDEEKLVQDVKPLIEEGGQILQECNGAIRALDPTGQIAATAKARAASHDASPEEYALADQLKQLTDTVVNCIDHAKRVIADMPHAKKELNPLWGLLSEPLFQIIAAVGLLLTGVLNLVGRLLNGLGLGPLLGNLLGGLGLDKLLGGLGLNSITDALGITGRK